jgi:hypothetical protein
MLNICLRIGIKITEQTFMTNLGIPSSPPDLGLSLLMALKTSAWEVGTRDKNSEDGEGGEMSTGQWLL